MFSHCYENISHWEKAEAHKGKVIFYLYLEKAKTTYQNLKSTSKFSLGLVLNHCFIPLPLSASQTLLITINPVRECQVVKIPGKISPADDFFNISRVHLQEPFSKYDSPC